MKKQMIMAAAIVIGLALISGCGDSGSGQVKTGFLSDYSKLEAASDSSYRYLNKSQLGNYKAFIVEPVSVYFKAGAKAIEAKSEGKMTEQDIKDLANYLHSAILTAINNSGRTIAYRPGPGIARLRVAITDIEETNVVLAAVPQSRMLTGAGVGGASMEAEVVDSVTGRQVGAVVEQQAGSRVPFTGLSDWGGAKSAMDEWAKRLQQRLNESR